MLFSSNSFLPFTMPNYVSRSLPFFFTFFFFALLQGWGTNLLPDEAYYTYYAQHPSLGHFDHPPMLEWWIALSSQFLPGELGVRFFPIIFNTLTLFTWFSLLKPQKNFLFFVSVGSLAVFQLSSSLALPDSPLLFFSSLFVWALHRWIYFPDQSARWASIAGICAAAMLWSKYTGILLIFFAFIFLLPFAINQKRLTSFFGLFVVAFLLFTPHLWWQLQHDFPSFRYHLQGRDSKPTNYLESVGFWLIIPLMLGPVLSLPMFKLAVKPSNDPFRKMLKGVFLCTVGFWILMSLKGKIEAHWIMPAVIPGFLLLYPELEKKCSQWFFKTITAVSVFVLLVRISLLFPLNIGIKDVDELHGREAYYSAIAKKANGLAVVFMNNHTAAAAYQFYTHQPAISHTNIHRRPAEYDLCNADLPLLGKPVLYIPNYAQDWFDSISIGAEKVYCLKIQDFQTYSDIHLSYTLNKTSNRAVLSFSNDDVKKLNNANTKEYAPKLGWAKIVDGAIVEEGTINIPNWKTSLEVDLPIAVSEQVRLGIRPGWIQQHW